MTSSTKNKPDLFGPLGYLEDPDLWTRELALGIAADEGIGEMTEPHWQLVDQLREHYLTAGNLPVQHTLCHQLDLAPRCIIDLFGGLIPAWKIAGLPDPGEEARAYMANME